MIVSNEVRLPICFMDCGWVILCWLLREKNMTQRKNERARQLIFRLKKLGMLCNNISNQKTNYSVYCSIKCVHRKVCAL
jgi:hypothetical protein